MNNKIKNLMINILGAVVTALATAVILLMTMYSLGYTIDYIIQHWPEFLVITVLTLIVRFFWYLSIENKELSSSEFEEKTQLTRQAITDSIKDITHFEKYLDILTKQKRQRYIDNKVSRLTTENYKLSLFDKLQRLDKQTAFIKYKHRVERRANRIRPFNSNNFISLIDNDEIGLDDRNYHTKHKVFYQISSIIISTITTAIFALVAFIPGGTGNWARALIYIASMLISVGQTIMTASYTTKRDFISFYRKLITIIESYEIYKQSNAEQLTMEGILNDN